MRYTLCEVNVAATDKLPAQTGDKSGVGVHYIDAYIKPMNATVAEGVSVKCKRRGLKIMLTAAGRKGDGLMRRLEVSTDPVVMLQAALQEAATAAGVELVVEDNTIYIDI